MLITVIAFAIVLTLIYGTYWFFVVRLEDREQQAVRRRLRSAGKTVIGPAIVKPREHLSVVSVLDHTLEQMPLVANPLRALVDRSGLSITVGAVVLASIFLAMAAFAVTLMLSTSLIGSAIAALLGVWVPVLYVKRKATKRMAQFEEQFPEAIDLIARCLRAGHALPTALQLAGEEVPDPVGDEFRTLFEQQNYGMSLPDALRAFAARTPVLDARFFVTAVLTQREMGGNLSEILDNLAAVIRERFTVKRQVRVISAHGRITAICLMFMPPVIGGVLILISPDHIRLLIDDPLGLRLLMGAAVLQLIGIMVIRRIVNVEY